ncbi:hypothetical protein [Sutcliffiella halmapala]|uniref:hypothetical protein n=1 Tax=Sutcliffiella halmapala TaxID=79882 RepID=UPI001473B794|nr:hypothetical protein [Sutcliffiella halmapala]
MTGILLAINFAISLLAIFFVIILYLKFSKVQQLEEDYRNLLKEAEDTISGYVYELKEENKMFLDKLPKTQQTTSNNEREEPIVNEIEPEITQDDVHTLLGQIAAVEDEVGIQSEEVDFARLTTYEQVSHLVEKGYSLEEIAKKLDKGKTEIELLWKFRQ